MINMTPEEFEENVKLFEERGWPRDQAEDMVRSGYIIPAGQKLSKNAYVKLYEEIQDGRSDLPHI